MGYTGIIRAMQQNLRLRRRYRNAYRERLIEINKPQDDSHSYFTPEEIKQEKLRLKNKIARRVKHNTIVGIIFLLFIILITSYFLLPTLFP